MSVRTYFTKSRRGSRVLGPTDEAILASIGRYYFLTAEQICRLHFSQGSLRYAQTKLKLLAEAGYLTRVFLPRREQHGSSPLLYALATPGRRHLLRRGIAVKLRYRPVEEEEHSYLFLDHTIAVNDLLIAAELLVRRYPTFVLSQLRHERELKTAPVVVSVVGEQGSQRVGVIPDGWLDIVDKARQERICFVIELDRGTVKRGAFQKKVQALLAFARGPYQEAFGREAITILIATTAGEKRRGDLVTWTEDVLVSSWLMAESDLFRIGSVAPGALTPEEAFLSPSWYAPFVDAPAPLLTLRGEES